VSRGSAEPRAQAFPSACHGSSRLMPDKWATDEAAAHMGVEQAGEFAVDIATTEQAISETLTAGDWPEAISLLEGAVAARPGQPDLHGKLAHACFQVGRPDDALASAD
jgi:predicted Zn-dependent protease